MESTEPLQQHCDYLLQEDSPFIVAERLTDLALVDDQINRLNDHIRDVHRTRSDFLYHSNQIHSPATTLPIEVLSAIFCHLVDPELRPSEPTTSSHTHLRQSFILSSVSSHWRQAALGTSELWEKIEAEVYEHPRLSGHVISAIQHCASYAHTLNISLSLPYWHSSGLLDTFTSAFFSTEIIAKVRRLKVYRVPPQWLYLISQLHDLRSLTLERHFQSQPLEGPEYRGKPITLPASLRSFYLRNVPTHGLPFLDQCQNLVKCEYRPEIEFIAPPGLISFSKPLVFTQLIWLVIPAQNGLQTIDSVKHLQMPSLKYLEIENHGIGKISPHVIIRFCSQASATLVKLKLTGSAFRFSLDDSRSLFRLLPCLRRLYIDSNRDIDCLPQLRKLSMSQIRSFETSYPSPPYVHTIMDLLRSRRSREGPIFLIDISGYQLNAMDPELKEEFKSAVEGYQIEVRNSGERVEFLDYGTDDSQEE
ncbi:hypothetical protein AGABI2DRAFT_121859 [Agaricus bisporus var. bisporus H97]|uniref:hypothetical protein n=1 Tax=Agaricus bisporus var. bisporus (strain H97 / ATCC MYA-4626 / FGSC 10389) TaxID=936046 RepID=UPI00029F576D|nr:hypothetical protein AGABI2DRAFT_121859 [Agaricus bisporus var. bisporus H97]EKV43722.1 hypothetical protein AGABI2DRAFT_121859 [Agaricus bisporus var. bisporus H97]